MKLDEAVDHLIYATPDLDRSAREMAMRFGTEPVVGGKHEGWGTRNVLFGLGERTYFEIVGPDPDSNVPPALFGLETMKEPNLVAWASERRGVGVEEVVRDAREAGIELGEPLSGSRRRPDGSLLSWGMSDPRVVLEGGVLPFFMEWRSGEHPASALPVVGRLADFTVHHPDPDRVSRALASLGFSLPVKAASRPHLTATVSVGDRTVQIP